MNMFQLLEKTVEKYSDQTFLLRENISYSEFLHLVKLRASTLHKNGVSKGDVVGILSHNIPEFPITLFAIWYLGGKCLLLDTNLTPIEYTNMTQLTGCKFVYGEKKLFFKTDNFKFFDICEKDKKIDDSLKPEVVESVDIATLSFTSGSTGTPKIVPLTHFNLIECSNSLESMNKWIKAGDIMYGFLPMYHVFGFSVELLATIHYGASVLLQPTVNPKEIMDDFSRFKPNIIPAVPRVWEVFRNKIIDTVKSKHKWWLVSFVLKYGKLLEKIGLKFLVKKVQKPILDVFGGKARLLIAGGAATKPEVETFYERLGLTFIQGYGLTETVGPICISKPTKNRLPFAFGSTTLNNEFEIREKNDDGVGVLWLKGHQVFNGYMNNDKVNKESFDEKGFFNTGDLVSLDKNGELHFAGRKKQVIVLDSGKNVYPDELEALYIQIPNVKNVAVFEHRLKDKAVAYAVFSVEDGVTLDYIFNQISLCNKKIASYKWVTHFAITNEDLPLTSTQKIKHHVVRKNLIDGLYPESRN